MNQSVSEAEAYKLNRDATVAEMQKSITVAAAVWDFLFETKKDFSPTHQINMLDTDTIRGVFEKHFPVPLENIRINFFLRAFSNMMQHEDELSPCAMWEAAHIIHHALYDPIETFERTRS